jgi:hypothetical protein
VNNDPVNWVDPDGLLPIPTMVAGGAIGGLVGGVTGAISAVAQGKDVKGVIAGAVGGLVNGAITGAAIGSGVGIPGVVAAGFVGGATGSVAETVIANGGVAGLDKEQVAKNAVKDGAMSAAATGLTTVGLPAAASTITNKAWNSAANFVNTMNGSFGRAGLTAHATQKTVAAVKPFAEAIINTLTDLAQDNSSLKTSGGKKGK